MDMKAYTFLENLIENHKDGSINTSEEFYDKFYELTNPDSIKLTLNVSGKSYQTLKFLEYYSALYSADIDRYGFVYDMYTNTFIHPYFFDEEGIFIILSKTPRDFIVGTFEEYIGKRTTVNKLIPINIASSILLNYSMVHNGG